MSFEIRDWMKVVVKKCEVLIVNLRERFAIVFSMIWIQIRFLWSLRGGSEVPHTILGVGEVQKTLVAILRYE